MYRTSTRIGTEEWLVSVCDVGDPLVRVHLHSYGSLVS